LVPSPKVCPRWSARACPSGITRCWSSRWPLCTTDTDACSNLKISRRRSKTSNPPLINSDNRFFLEHGLSELPQWHQLGKWPSDKHINVLLSPRVQAKDSTEKPSLASWSGAESGHCHRLNDDSNRQIDLDALPTTARSAPELALILRPPLLLL